jgi:hypothetical protein
MMLPGEISKHGWMTLAGAGRAAGSAVFAPAAITDAAGQVRRMQGWHQTKFGMFVHWGLYGVLGRHERVMEQEGIPVAEYEQRAQRFTPKPNAARDWAKLAKRAGQKYMVMTTEHHEGFCLFDSNPTNYCALPGDFQTPEQRIVASDKAWEACMTMNDSWAFSGPTMTGRLRKRWSAT